MVSDIEALGGKIDGLSDDVRALVQAMHKVIPALGHQSAMLRDILEAVTPDEGESPLAEALRAILGICRMSADRLGRIEDRVARIHQAVERPL